MSKQILLAILLLGHAVVAFALPLGSHNALIVEEGTGKVLYEKNATRVVPIASLTKLMTAMVLLDTKPDLGATVRIDDDDVDELKGTSSRLPVGARVPLRAVLRLALTASDNRAAAALARVYPGGKDAFSAAVRAKLRSIGMSYTTIVEPTGLSARNTSSAADLARMAYAASRYPEIVAATTVSQANVVINGRTVRYRNTNRLVGKPGWHILLSKTGFTRAAGKCIIMRMKTNGRNVIVVLLNAKASSIRTVDAIRVRQFVAAEVGSATMPQAGTKGAS